MRHVLSSCIVFFACVTQETPAQSIVVDPNGGGQFTSLQAAIDAATPGASIEVRGGTYTALRVGKSLRIAGNPPPLLLPGSAAQTGSGGQRNEPAIWLEGSGSEVLHLANLRTGGTSSGARFAYGASGIAGGGFAELGLYDCVVRGAPWVLLTGVATGSPGIELAGSVRLTLVRTAVFGGPSDADYLYYSTTDGGAGVAAPAGTVIAIDTTIEGGEGCWLGDRFSGPPSTPCPCPNLTGGRGGTGLVATRAFLSGTTARGGRGAFVYFNTCYPGSCLVPWGRQPDGAAFAVAELHELDRDFLLASPARLGGSLDLVWPSAYPAPLLLAAAPGAPLDLGALGYLFAELATLQSLPTIHSGNASYAIPADPLLFGTPLALQLLYPPRSTYAREGLSRPLLELLR